LSGVIDVPPREKEVPGMTERRPRVAIYEPWWPLMDAGWTRWVFDEYGIRYEQLRDGDARAGGLAERFDVIVLPDGPAQRMISGSRDGSMPREYVGGLGESGVRGLEEFVEAGGTLIAFNNASSLPIEQFQLPVVNVLDGLERSEFYVPGSILRLNLDPGHWLAEGSPTRTIAWFERGMAFEPSDDAAAERVEVVGRYGEDEVLLSGWITGAEHIAGHGAMVVVQRGRGRVVLFGFKPQYRGQTIATYPLIFNALKGSTEATSKTGSADRLGSGW
jgi:hypothetical protein